jgi:curved DNA-binding protein
MEFKDYYKVMGVARDATEAQIKQAYRKLARKYHPDVSKEKDAEARFKEVGEAYEVLRSPEKRAAYDQLGQGHPAGEDFRPPPDWGAGFEFSGAGARDSDYSDFFESLFGAQARAGAGNRRGAFHPGRGEDHHAKVLLDLDATLRGQGARAPGEGTPGDLFIEVEFQPHPLYRVDGRDLYLDLPVAPWEAALGATAKTPTPGGTVDLKIPAASHAGSKLRLKGRGIPASPPGDFYVVLQIALPAANDDKAKAAYAAMAAALPFNPRANLGV